MLLLTACDPEAASTVYLEANFAQLDQPAGADNPMSFVVEPGTPARTIAENLQAAGLIKDARLFEAYVRTYGLANQLEAGEFTLSPAMTPVEIAEALQHALAPGILVTIPEGWRYEQVAEYLSANTPISGEEYDILAADAALHAERYPFLADLPAGTSLEGYLYPDSYQLDAENPTAAHLIDRQLREFAERVAPAYTAAREAETTDYSLHQLLTLASIVEREAVIPAERPTIAGVYHNRLVQDMKLEADPTVQYAMGFQADSGQWWKTPVFIEEYQSVISPYNTYLNPGLPPGPIASPGLSSIEAVLNPEQHDFLFFVATPDGDGAHVFSRTFQEHLKNVQRYRGQ